MKKEKARQRKKISYQEMFGKTIAQSTGAVTRDDRSIFKVLLMLNKGFQVEE